MRRSPMLRRGVVSTEFAFVAPILFMILLGILLGAIAIFRYQEMAWLAREGARYASTRNRQWATDASTTSGSTKTSLTEAELRTYLQSRVFLIPADDLTVTAVWQESSSPQKVSFVEGITTVADNTVTVTVGYTFQLSVPLMTDQTITVSSTATSPLGY